MDEVRSTNTVEPPTRVRRRRWPVVLGVLVALLAAITLAVPTVLSPYVQRKLEATVSNHLHARIEIGSLSYRFPYGVAVRDAKFVTDESHGDGSGGVQLLSVRALDLRRAKLPIGEGPIVIESFSVIDPIVQIVRREDGSIVGSHLAKKQKDASQPRERMKVSDLLQLRQFTLRGATVRFDDRKHRDAKPMEWRNISAKLNLEPRSGSRYAVRFNAQSEPVADIVFNGAGDVDTRVIDVEKLTISANVQRDGASSPLPAQFQEILQKLGIEGAVKVEVTGQLPLNEPKSGRFVVNAVLDRVRAQPPDARWALDELSAKITAERGNDDERNAIDLKIADVNARGMGASIEIPSVLAAVDVVDKTWRFDELRGVIRAVEIGEADQPSRRPRAMRFVQRGRVDFEGSARGSYAPGIKRIARAGMLAKLDRLSIYPPNFPEPIDAITGQITLNGERAVVQNVTALYGNDRLALNQAVAVLSDPTVRIDFLNILGSIDFVAPVARYTHPLDDVMDQLKPSGKIDLQGVAALYRRGKRFEPDYSLQLTPRGTAVSLVKNQMPVTNLQGEIQIAPRLIQATYLEGDAFGGKLAVRGNLVPRMPVTYDGELRAQEADLALLSSAFGWRKSDGSPSMTGRSVVKLRFNGQVPKKGEGDAFASLAGRGRVRVRDGNFWSLATLDGITKQIKFAHDALTAGEAAAVFEIKDGKVEIQRAAINSSALGVQGSGVLDISGDDRWQMDLRVVAAPLGDWRRKLRSTGIPLISRLAGDAAGALQKLVNSATSQLLYEFRVKGEAGKPQITTVPAPILTDSAANLFGLMMRGTRPETLDEAVGGRDTEEPFGPTRGGG